MIVGIDARPLLTTPRTGVGEFTYELLSNLFKKNTGHQFILFANAFQSEQSLPFCEYSNVQWVTTRMPNKFFHLSIFLFGYPHLDVYVAKRAGVKQIDTWYSPNLHFTSLSKKVKHILTVHDLSFHHYPSFFSTKGRMWHKVVKPKKQITNADIIFTPSHHTARDVASVYGVTEKKVHTLYPGACSHLMSKQKHTVEHVKEKYDLPDSFLLYLGTLEPRKNIDGILDAYNRSSYLKKKMQIIFAGAPGYRGERYKKMIAQTEGARYIGYVDELDKYGLYTMSHAFVYPSLYEGFGLPVLEAISCGTPVVVSHRTSLPEVAGDVGILVNPYNVSELQKNMENIVHDKHLYSRMKEQAHIQSVKFSWDLAVGSFIEQLDKL
mgnify:CR=1 FL=1|jgi:glycosyltransferase involved in cell wall biosynthesis